MAGFAATEYRQYEVLVDRLATLGIEAEDAMQPFVAPFSAFHDRTRPRSWVEGLIKAYVGDGIAKDFYREMASFVDAETRAVMDHALDDAGAGDFIVSVVRDAIQTDPTAKGRLSLWGRRLLGEALSQGQSVAVERDALTGLLVGGGADLTAIGQMFTRLTDRHSQRMARLGLSRLSRRSLTAQGKAPILNRGSGPSPSGCVAREASDLLLVGRHAVAHDEEGGNDDAGEERDELEPAVAVAVAQLVDEPGRDERTQDAEDDGHEDRDALLARKNEASQGPDDGADDDGADDGGEHGMRSFLALTGTGVVTCVVTLTNRPYATFRAGNAQRAAQVPIRARLIAAGQGRFRRMGPAR